MVSEIDKEIIKWVHKCRFDPLLWSEIAWEWGRGDLTGHLSPRDWQKDIFRTIKEHLNNEETRFQPLRIAVSSGHGIGKSASMGMISNWAMSCFADAKIVTTANTDGQLRTKTAPEIGKWFRGSLTAHWFDVQSQSIKSRERGHENLWRQDFIPWSQHNTEAFAGLHNQGKIIVLLFDEASRIHDKVWEVAEGALTDENTIILWIVYGNPTRNTGRFRECFRKFRHRWVTRKIDSRTVDGTNKAQIEQWRQDHGDDSDFFKVRVRGEFPEQSALQFISIHDVDAARSRHLRPEQFNFAPVVIGVDPAWSGDDALEIVLRQGLYSKSLVTLAKNDNDVEIANLIARLEDEHKADAVFIDAGYGTGIVSAGNTMGRSWQIVWFSGKASDPGYLNKRSEIWGNMKKWLKEGGVIDPSDDELYQDLISPETVPRLDGKIQLEGKKDMKARGLPSPNKGDALALTFSHPVGLKQSSHFHQASLMKADYDPFAV